MNEYSIIKHVRRFFATAEYELQNVFIWDWESDYFCITTSGYTVEVEVKISRSDFKADSKKTQKHFILKNSAKDQVVMPLHSYEPEKYSTIAIVKPKGPNKFYYCCPEEMIKPEEVPEYAGLLYFREVPDNKNEHTYDSIIQAKPAKFLHKNKPDISKVLLDKYYHLYLNLRAEYKMLERHAKTLQEKYNPDSAIQVNKKYLNESKIYEPKLFENW